MERFCQIRIGWGARSDSHYVTSMADGEKTNQAGMKALASPTGTTLETGS